MIDTATVSRILDTARIEEVVSDYVTLRKRGVNLIGLCPFHDEKTGSFTVSPAKGIFKCFGCGKGGNAVHFIMEIEQLSYPDALKVLAKKYNIEVKERELSPEELNHQNDRESMFVLNSFAQKQFSQWLHEHPDGRSIGLSYFRERGFRDDIIRKFQLGYCLDQWDAFSKAAFAAGYKQEFLEKTGLSYATEAGRMVDRFHGRVMFPVHTLSGKVVAFGGRILKKNDKTAKYVNSPESEIYHKSNELYGIYFAKQAIVKHNCCYLVEGYTDVISMHQAGIENVVASSGTSLTPGQIRLIHRFTENVTVLYDGDAAGIKASLRGIDLLLEEGLNIKVLLLPDGEDPDSFARKQNASDFIAYVGQHQTDFIRFKTNLLLDEAGKDPIRRAVLIQDVVRSIAIIPNDIVRRVYVKDCSTLLDMDEKVLLNAIAKIKREKWQEANTHNAAVQNVMPESDKSADSVPTSCREQSDNAPAATDMKLSSGMRFEAETRNLLQLLVRYGDHALYAEDDGRIVSVGEYILQELADDDITFDNPLYMRLIDEYARNCTASGFIAEKYFKYHPDSELSQLAINLIAEKYTLSKVHFKVQVSENTAVQMQKIPTDAERLLDLAPRLVFELKESLLKDKIRQTLLQMKQAYEEGDDTRGNELMNLCDRLNAVQRSLSKNLGERVIIKL